MLTGFNRARTAQVDYTYCVQIIALRNLIFFPDCDVLVIVTNPMQTLCFNLQNKNLKKAAKIDQTFSNCLSCKLEILAVRQRHEFE